MRDLNYRHLYYFWRVAREGHLTNAASALRVAQSALSVQIRQLERSLGCDLFERKGRGLALTDAGHAVFGFAGTIFGLGQELVAAVRGKDAGRLRHVRIGAVATLSRNFQSHLLVPLLRNEHLQVTVESAALRDLIARLRDHQLDVVLSNTENIGDARRPLLCRRIARHAVIVVGPRRPQRAPFRFPRDLAGSDLILPGSASEIRAQLDARCELAGLRLEPRAEIDDMALLRLLARDSGAVAVVPEVVVRDEVASGQLEEYCRIAGIHENFYAITSNRREAVTIVEELLAAEPLAIPRGRVRATR